MFSMENISTKDFVANHLRLQVNRLNGVLRNIEEERKVDCVYATDSLKEVEVNLRHIRKICLNYF